ncbi:MAG: hypothetical protein HY959_10355 [Ignavibacteriae bacterium]|nr:hypothetical protein [Ignavibacteriota bacterium]
MKKKRILFLLTGCPDGARAAGNIFFQTGRSYGAKISMRFILLQTGDSYGVEKEKNSISINR